MEPPLISGEIQVGLFSLSASSWGIEHLAPELPVKRSKMLFLRAFPAFWHRFPRL